MYRALGVVGIIAGLGLVSWAAPKSTHPPSMIQKLNQRANFEGISNVRATLDDALEKLGKLYDVSFEIHEQAFKTDGLMEVGRTEIAQPTPIPEMKNARLSQVLRKILQRVPAPSGTTFLVRGDYIEITTGTFQSQAIWGNYEGPHLPLVNLVLDKRPLEDAVRELADLSEFNITVDSRAGGNVKTPVSARFLNTPLDTALRLLTDMADLRSVHIDNVLYVTTKDNAVALEARLEKEKATDNSEHPDATVPGHSGWRKGSGRDSLLPLGAGGA
jgi:hypothetical protein